MSRLYLLIATGIFIAIFAASSSPVFACSCFPKSTLPDEFGRSGIVATMKLASVETAKDDSNPRYPQGYTISAKMIVEKVFKGEVKAGDELLFRSGGGGNCLWGFNERSIGVGYLFYLGAPTTEGPFRDPADADRRPKYNAIICGRSGRADEVDQDIAFLNDLKKNTGRTRVSGTLLKAFEGTPSLANLSVRFVSSTGAYETKTNKTGSYEIFDLPEGEYAIELAPPDGWKPFVLRYMRDGTDPTKIDIVETLNKIRLSVKKGENTDLDLGFERIGAIRGRVISPDGFPMDRVSVRAIPFDGLKDWERSWGGTTNKDGEFSFRNLVPGDYALVIGNRRIGSVNPFRMIFYPGTEDIQNAARIKVLGTVDNLVVRIPTAVKLVEFTGRFLYSDGKLISGQRVGFDPDEPEKYEREEMTTDKNGNFKFLIPLQATGNIWGRFYIHTNAAENCPKQKERILAAGSTELNLKANGLRIKGDDLKRTVDITLDFPSCEKSQ